MSLTRATNLLDVMTIDDRYVKIVNETCRRVTKAFEQVIKCCTFVMRLVMSYQSWCAGFD